jgi:signal peptidase II
MSRNFQTHWNSLLRPPDRSWRLWLLLSVLVLFADQAIKQIVVALMTYGTSSPITSFFNLVHVRNPGAAFSFLADAGGWQRYFFIVIGIAVPAVLAWLLRRGVANWMEALAYSLIIGGAIGNVIDRIVLGFVVDYLDFHWRGWHWPAFNVADMAITGGAILLVISSFFMASAPPGEAMKRRDN